MREVKFSETTKRILRSYIHKKRLKVNDPLFPKHPKTWQDLKKRYF